MIDETFLRVRYSETDQMGIVYYANYFVWMEVGRTNLIRNFGITYKELEEKGFLLPVVYTSARFISPAYYDDEIVVQSALIEMTKTKLSVGYRIFRITSQDKRELVCVGLSDLVFLDKETRRIVRAPEFFVNAVKIQKSPEYDKFIEDIQKILKY